MQNHKLGDWSLGESCGILYDPNQYDKEREHMEQMALMELKKEDEVTGMLREVYDMDDIFNQQEIDNRINNEVYNIQHLAEDDDFADGMDGDQFY